MRRAAAVVLVLIAAGAIGASWISPQEPWQQFSDRAYAPPMRVHLRDADGWHAPFVYRQVLQDRLTRTFGEDRAARVPLRWLRDGRLATIDRESGPLLLLGADALGRDVWARVWHGARRSLGVAVVGAFGALLLGAWLGAVAGLWRGWIDTTLTILADFLIVLPGVYLVFLLRAAMPLTLDGPAVFILLLVLFTLAGWPHVARGVRAITVAERQRDYVEAARASGAGAWRLVRHVLPASAGFLRTEFILLVPAFLVAESTVSYLGLGFLEPVPSWGLMLKDASGLSAMQRAPWMLTPAFAMFLVVFALQRCSREPWRP